MPSSKDLGRHVEFYKIQILIKAKLDFGINFTFEGLYFKFVGPVSGMTVLLLLYTIMLQTAIVLDMVMSAMI